MYQYINIDGDTFVSAQNKLGKLTKKEKDKVTDLYVQLLQIWNSITLTEHKLRGNYAKIFNIGSSLQ